jgi:diguanylate cyclase (GGDEF)-like protein
MPPSDVSPPPTSSLLPPDVLARLREFGTTEQLNAGCTIFERGDRGSSMYVIESGEVVLYFEPERTIKRLAPGEFFGELALITGDHLRSGTARAATTVTLQSIDQQAFATLLMQHPTASVNLLRSTCAYLLESEQELLDDLRRRNRELEQALDYLRRTKEDLDTTEVLARTDELTGLYNKRCLHRQCGPLMEKATATASGLALILVDLDRFKCINDTLGHAVGDRVLAAFARILRSVIRQTDLPYRIGGDEFAVLLANIDAAAAKSTAQRLLRAVHHSPVAAGAHTVDITCSIGGTLMSPSESWEQLFERADQSLYLAKRTGRDRMAWNQDIVLKGDDFAQPTGTAPPPQPPGTLCP